MIQQVPNLYIFDFQVYPAFWIRAGSHETNNRSRVCHVGSHAINTVDVYRHNFSKEVTLGCFGMDNCIQFVSGFVVAGQWPKYDFLNLVAPTGYLTGDFTIILNYNPLSHQLEPHTRSTWPPVLATPDNKYAMGVYAPAGQRSDKFMYYGTGTHEGHFAWKTNVWSVVFRRSEFPAGSSTQLTYYSYICIGTTNMVVECLRKLQQEHPHI